MPASTKRSIIFLSSIYLDPLEQATVTWQRFIYGIFFDAIYSSRDGNSYDM